MIAWLIFIGSVFAVAVGPYLPAFVFVMAIVPALIISAISRWKDK